MCRKECANTNAVWSAIDDSLVLIEWQRENMALDEVFILMTLLKIIQFLVPAINEVPDVEDYQYFAKSFHLLVLVNQ
jgi:hypothetical protein